MLWLVRELKTECLLNSKAPPLLRKGARRNPIHLNILEQQSCPAIVFLPANTRQHNPKNQTAH